MQAEFQAWYEPLDCSPEDEKEVVAPEATRLGGGGPKPKLSHLDHNKSNHPRPAHHHPPNSVGSVDSQQHVVATISTRERERGALERIGLDRGGATPTRRPRPPVDAWGTPPASASHRRGSPSFATTGSASGGGGSVGFAAEATGGGRGAVHGGAGGGGLLPPLTGKQAWTAC